MRKKRISLKYIALLILIGFLALSFYPSPAPEPVRYVDRQTGAIKTEKVPGEGWLIWLYNNPVGELTLNALVKRKFVSSVYGRMMDKPSSADKIPAFVQEYDIDLSIAKTQEFTSFNDFFTRELKKSARPVDTGARVIISPADGKILAWNKIPDTHFIVKGRRFDVSAFLDDPVLAEKFQNGPLVIVRLAPDDYHRFHFPVSGTVTRQVQVKGDYYSVNPLALRQTAEVFFENKREYAVIETARFGDVVMAEVGATMVGSIIQTYPDNRVLKGEEKGYFKFGGSTVVLLFEPNKILIDNDLLANTRKGLETYILMGERIATGIKTVE